MVTILYDNLLRNVLRYAEGEQILLRFTAEMVGDTPETRQWQYGVWNSGSSIPQEDLEEIFKIFRKSHLNSDGTGVGLSICRKVAQRHQGEIHASSQKDSVHFYFTLGEWQHAN